MNLKLARLLLLSAALAAVMAACGDSGSEVSSGELTVAYDNSVSIDQAQALVDWNIWDGHITSGQIALSHENDEFMIHIAGNGLPDKATSDIIQTVTCGVSYDVFEGTQVRFLWIENPQDTTNNIFDLVKNFRPSRDWNCKAPIIFSPEQAGNLLLESTDFPDDWLERGKVTRNTGALTVSARMKNYANTRTLNILLETHDTESMAHTAFANRKAEVERIIDNREPTILNNDIFQLEEIDDYPMFIWKHDWNIYGDRWKIEGVYGNIVLTVWETATISGSMSLTKEIARKQMDKIQDATPLPFTPKPSIATNAVQPQNESQSENSTVTQENASTATPVSVAASVMAVPENPTDVIPVTLSWEDRDNRVNGEAFQGLEGTPLYLSSIDIQGSVSVGRPIVIDWGDGSLEEKSLDKGQRTIQSLSHSYIQDGTYRGSIKATDTQGGEWYSYFDSAIRNTPPEIVEVKTPLVSLDEEGEFEIRIGDPGILDPHMVIIDWGDGSGASSYSMEPGQTKLNLTHTYVVDSGGKPYGGTINITDEKPETGSGTGYFSVRLLESFQELYYNDFPKLLFSNDNFLTVEVTEAGVHIIGNEFQHFVLKTRPDDLNIEWNSLSSIDTTIMNKVYGSDRLAGIALSNEDIFVLGTHESQLWNRAAIYNIPSDSWSYPFKSITKYKLRGSSLTLLKNGKVLITGGSYWNSQSTSYQPYESAEIYDPVTQTFKPLGINHMAQRIDRSDTQIRTLGLRDGRLLLMSHRDGGFISLFDPSSEQFYNLTVQKNLKMNDICDIQPKLLKDGSIFLGGILLKPDLLTIERLDIDNCSIVNDNPQVQMSLGNTGLITLENDTILIVGGDSYSKAWYAWIFDGRSYRPTTYPPPTQYDSVNSGAYPGSGSGYVYEPRLFHGNDGSIIMLVTDSNFQNKYPLRPLYISKFFQALTVSSDQAPTEPTPSPTIPESEDTANMEYVELPTPTPAPTATPAWNTYKLYVNGNQVLGEWLGVGNALIQVSPAPDSSSRYKQGTEVTLMALASDPFSYEFKQWAGECQPFGIVPTCTVTMSQEVRADVEFRPVAPTPTP